MNFFEHQAKARRQSRRLVFLFILAVLAIMVSVDLVLLLAFGFTDADQTLTSLVSMEGLAANADLLVGGAAGTLAVIGLASLFRSASLKAGGGKIARELGGTLVESDTRDPRRRRLRNVVEEIALASGVPVPEIYVLEREGGINAFAAGYSPDDAAIAVTRGTLEKLSREELQGVIAHEFSHILNGDMRINIRLMGALFGILMLALIGRRILIHSHFTRGSRDKNGAPILLIAIGVMIIGYVGMFFGRWIKSAISRQREYLADSSAVQFTRNPQGIGGALKKIAVYSDASYLEADSEEISHMLFGGGRKMMLFSTHPPIEERIGRIEPGFKADQLGQLAEKIQRDELRRSREDERTAQVADTRVQDVRTQDTRQAGAGAGMFDARNIIDQIGQPDWQRILVAASLAASIPENIRQAAHSTEWAPEVLLFTLLDQDPNIREQQLLIISRKMGSDSERQVHALLAADGLARPEQRLPLMEMALPALKRRPPAYVQKVLETVQALVDADGRVEVFEYLLAKVIAQHLWAAVNPRSAHEGGSGSISSARKEVLNVLSVLSWHGAPDVAHAETAFSAGLAVLKIEGQSLQEVGDWTGALDFALPRLDRLRLADKEKLVTAMIEVVLQDGRLEAEELELLRVICDLIHVPLPMLAGQHGAGSG
jgi:Zn-dependent protease with chaperone function